MAEPTRGWRFGGTPAEARDAGRLLERNPSAALEVLRRGAHARVERGGMIRALEVTLLVLLERPDEALAAIEAGRGDPAIGFLIWFGPALDPLAEDARFRRLMEDANLLLPRWRRSG